MDRVYMFRHKVMYFGVKGGGDVGKGLEGA